MNKAVLSFFWILIFIGLGFMLYGCDRTEAVGGPDLDELRTMRLDRQIPGHETIPDPFDTLTLTREQVLEMGDSVVMRAVRLRLKAEELEAKLIKDVIVEIDKEDSVLKNMIKKLEAEDER